MRSGMMAAIVGAAGLLPTLGGDSRREDDLLANKESLVTCVALFMDEVKRSNARLYPRR